jgi:oxygen-independent coproporphyrinogen III oxidase
MTDRLLQAYSHPVPRYTSYPTAPHFSEAVGAEAYAEWLGRLQRDASLSLYVHVPFCDTLCWFCGCHTKITRRYRPVGDYLDRLKKEIAAVAEQVEPGCGVRHIHWGGGSPTILKGDDIRGLADALRSAFSVEDEAEFAVEIDPRGLQAEELDALAAAGVTRASIGIQDFNPEVQEAINRVQPFEETQAVIEGLRERGIRAINTDLMYGLPNQTPDGIADTIDKVLTLGPDRIALFGYAHVPWMKRHQQMIPEASLPSVEERFSQADFAARLLVDAEYRRIGLDHFARADDPLALAAANGTLRRNFQGYTTDTADALIGFGASAIGRLPQGFVQNQVPIPDYLRRVDEAGIATVRGYEFTRDDLRRAHLIERLMCDMSLSWSQIERRIGPADDLRAETEEPLSAFARDGLIEMGRDGFAVTERGRPFVRTICSAFDAYLKTGQARHSIAV